MQFLTTSSSRDDVDRCIRIRIGRSRLALVGGPVSLHIVLMSVHEKINTLFEEEFLESIRSVGPRSESLLSRFLLTIAVARTVHASMTVYDNPCKCLSVSVIECVCEEWKGKTYRVHSLG